MSKPATTLRRGLPATAGGFALPADRRFRRPDVRPNRRRNWHTWLRRGLWYGGGGVVVLALMAWIGSALLDASVLRIDQIVVRGQVKLSNAEIEWRLAGLRGASLLRADLEQFRLRLVDSPWVASAELWRVLPSTVQVRIVERTPLAIARLHRQLYLVDASGVIIDSFGPQYQEFDLPIVDGLMTVAPGGPVVDADRIRLVERLLQDMAVRDDLLQRISQINVADVRNAVVLLDGEHAELRLGDAQFRERLQRYEETAPSLAGRPPAEYYDLRYGDWMWVK